MKLVVYHGNIHMHLLQNHSQRLGGGRGKKAWGRSEQSGLSTLFKIPENIEKITGFPARDQLCAGI